MSQRRNKYKRKDHNQVSVKQEREDTSLYSLNDLFETIHPPESYTSPKAVMILSSVHIVLLNVLLIVGQFFVLFGNVY